jgi:hypothetical protein
MEPQTNAQIVIEMLEKEVKLLQREVRRLGKREELLLDVLGDLPVSLTDLIPNWKDYSIANYKDELDDHPG